jgi:Protein of unknown function (DUF2874).
LFSESGSNFVSNSNFKIKECETEIIVTVSITDHGYDYSRCTKCKITASSTYLQLPVTIVKYMEQNHQGAVINKISKEYFGYEIGVLDADHEYRFNRAGQYIGWDD